jgi:cellulose synthase/poly-beta-1,6-N-acetylglucosamine synthase-like glycosyltransferase
MSGVPAIRLSVVIAAHNAAHVIEPCLEALAPQRRGGEVEIIVSDSSTDGTPDRVARRFPWASLLHFDEPLTLPQLRGRAIGTARGEIIAILDPFSVAAPDWVERTLEAHARRASAVIGGSVDLHRAGSRSMRLWTTYLNEYGLFTPPIAEGPASIVPGSNVSYKRAALFDGGEPRYPVFWKTFANWDIDRSGSPLWLEPGVAVALNKPLAFGDYLRTRFHHGRCFAGMRVQEAGWSTRLWRAATSPALPVVLTWRLARGFWPKRRLRWRFALTIPAHLVLFGVWACGEACGYVFGPGRSCEQLFY